MPFNKNKWKRYVGVMEIVHGHLESQIVTPAQHYIAECQSGFALTCLCWVSSL